MKRNQNDYFKVRSKLQPSQTETRINPQPHARAMEVDTCFKLIYDQERFKLYIFLNYRR